MTGKIDINEALVTAATEGRTDEVLKLLVEGADINYTNPHGNTALLKAAEGGHDNLVEQLISKGANIDAKNDDGQTLLISAVFYGDTETVKRLINKGANIDAKDDDNGRTALMLAAMGDDTATVKFLLKKGANIEARDDGGYPGGQTALMLAAKKGNPNIVKLLLKNRADIEAKDNNGDTALDLVMMDEMLDDEPDSRRTEIMALLKSKTTAKKRKALSARYEIIGEINKASERDMSGWKTFPIEELFKTKDIDDKDEIVPGKSIQPGAKGPIPVPVYATPKAESTTDKPENKKSVGKPSAGARSTRKR